MINQLNINDAHLQRLINEIELICHDQPSSLAIVYSSIAPHHYSLIAKIKIINGKLIDYENVLFTSL